MMLGKRTNPVIGKLSELLVPVNRATFSDALMTMTTTSPRSPLDFKILSQISPRNNPKRIYDNNLSGGVGLGIIAALENSGMFGNFPVSSGSSGPTRRSRSDPIPVANNKRCSDERFAAGDEDYTYVTCHRGPDGSYTRVFRDGGEYCCSSMRNNESERPLVSVINGSDGFSGVRPEFLECSMEASAPKFQCLDFLSSCYLCKKKLHGQDIYMYRGEKAFCSVECRSSHITMDDRKEKCRSDFPTSPYAPGQIFSTGVLVI